MQLLYVCTGIFIIQFVYVQIYSAVFSYHVYTVFVRTEFFSNVFVIGTWQGLCTSSPRRMLRSCHLTCRRKASWLIRTTPTWILKTSHGFTENGPLTKSRYVIVLDQDQIYLVRWSQDPLTTLYHFYENQEKQLYKTKSKRKTRDNSLVCN